MNLEPASTKPGCSTGVILLCSITLLTLCCVIPLSLWAPLGVFYEVVRTSPDAAAVASNAVAKVILYAGTPLVVINLLWVAYALWRWRTTSSETPTPPRIFLQGDVGDRFTDKTTLTQEHPSPNVQTGHGTFKRGL
jgi:hypothetical protein